MFLRQLAAKTAQIYRREAKTGMRRLSGGEKLKVRLSVIGAGKMAEAMANGLMTKDFPRDVSLHVFDPNTARADFFNTKFGAVIHPDVKSCLADADIVLLACKPQNVKKVGESMCGHIGPKTVVLSILAGTTLSLLKEHLGSSKLVRSMPNTPAAVQEGVTVWTATDNLTPETLAVCGDMLGAFGDQHFVEDEKYLDMATALSGSGPAYVLLLMESMIECGVHFGFPRALATKLTHQTIKGTAVYAMSSEENSASMRADITSPGGTTAAALYSLERGRFRTVVADGLWSAYRRSLELGDLDSNVGPNRSQRK